MAKEDFCFTYYDGDALRDMSHMNRLERGAYGDIVLQQRKFGRLTIEQIKKILGKDFDECWPSVNLVLIFDEVEKKYFLEWLEKSIQKMKKHSKKQTENVSKRYQTSTNPLPKTDLVIPLEDENGNEDELKKIKETILTTESNDLNKALCEYFAIKPILTSNIYDSVCDYVEVLQHRNETTIAAKSLTKYIVYKGRSQESKHGIEKWIGTKASHYRDGVWNLIDWDLKVKNLGNDRQANKRTSDAVIPGGTEFGSFD